MRLFSFIIPLVFVLPAAVHAETLVVGVAQASEGQAMFGATSRIDVAFDQKGFDEFALYSAARVGRPIYLYVEGDLIMTATLTNAVTNGRISLNAGPAGYGKRGKQELLEYLNSGGEITISDRPL